MIAPSGISVRPAMRKSVARLIAPYTRSPGPRSSAGSTMVMFRPMWSTGTRPRIRSYTACMVVTWKPCSRHVITASNAASSMACRWVIASTTWSGCSSRASRTRSLLPPSTGAPSASAWFILSGSSSTNPTIRYPVP